MSKSERVREEATALWIEMFGEPPSHELDSRELLAQLLQRLEPKGYARLSQAVRARDLTFPR